MIETRYVVAALMTAALWVVGCSSEPKQMEPPEEGPKVEVGSHADSQAAERERTTAFGLPLPPRVEMFQHQSEDIATVLTDMDVVALGEFYRKNLVDYEVIRNGLHLRAVGLRSGMPQIRGFHLSGPRSYVRLEYTSQRIVPEKPESPEEVAEREARERARGSTRANVPGGGIKGSPVQLRLPSGELLAPGAKWGEPYTPKPGSPLHKEEFKSNWGKPFGEWQPG